MSDVAYAFERAQSPNKKKPTVNEIYPVAKKVVIALTVNDNSARVLGSMSPSFDTKGSEGAADESAFNKVRTKIPKENSGKRSSFSDNGNKLRTHKGPTCLPRPRGRG
jgi:hypothetical protein